MKAKAEEIINHLNNEVTDKYTIETNLADSLNIKLTNKENNSTKLFEVTAGAMEVHTTQHIVNIILDWYKSKEQINQ